MKPFFAANTPDAAWPLGLNERNVRLIFESNDRKGIAWAKDKVKTKSLLTHHGIPVPRTRCVIDSLLQASQLWPALSGQCVIKPARGSGGGGILLLTGDAANGWHTPDGAHWKAPEILQHVAEILHGRFSFGDSDAALVEDLLVAHPDIARLHGPGIADIRLIHRGNALVLAMLRMPSRASGGKANLHQGGVAAPVDLNSGRLGPVFTGSTYQPNHPDGPLCEGHVLPQWDEVVAAGRQVASCAPLGYMGIDVVVDARRGPLVLEVNARPGLEIQNVNRSSLRACL